MIVTGLIDLFTLKNKLFFWSLKLLALEAATKITVHVMKIAFFFGVYSSSATCVERLLAGLNCVLRVITRDSRRAFLFYNFWVSSLEHLKCCKSLSMYIISKFSFGCLLKLLLLFQAFISGHCWRYFLWLKLQLIKLSACSLPIRGLTVTTNINK